MTKARLHGLKILVTAGPTREFFDPVRFLSNPSSGKMGYALAEAAALLGAQVTLISGPVSLKPSDRLKKSTIISVVSAEDMYRAVIKIAAKMDIIIMAAAVSDYRSVTYSSKKMKKSGKSVTLKMEPTKDILKELGRRKKAGQILVGFAAETNHVAENALKKLQAKNLDFIVANHVGTEKSGFEIDTNEAILFASNNHHLALPSMSKEKMALKILHKISATVGNSPCL